MGNVPLPAENHLEDVMETHADDVVDHMKDDMVKDKFVDNITKSFLGKEEEKETQEQHKCPLKEQDSSKVLVEGVELKNAHFVQPCRVKTSDGCCISRSNVENKITDATSNKLEECLSTEVNSGCINKASDCSISVKDSLQGIDQEHTQNCDFCKHSSEFVCTYCGYYFCGDCIQKYHPKIGPFVTHKVINVAETTEKWDKCEIHNIVAVLMCSYCNKKRCLKCANTTCILHFKGKVSTDDIDNVKKYLLEEMEKTTSLAAFVETYKVMLDEMKEQIQTTALMRKEYIQQEFISFHDLLIQKKEEILTKLDQEVSVRLYNVQTNLDSSIAKLLKNEVDLTSTVIDLVQSANDSDFIERYVPVTDQFKSFQDKVSDFKVQWAKNFKFDPCFILDHPFSLLHEKQTLEEKLNAALGDMPKLNLNRRVFYHENLSSPLPIVDFVENISLPPSTELIFCVELKLRDCTIGKWETHDLKGVVTPLRLQHDSRYLLKITPKFVCHTSVCTSSTWMGNAIHTLIVTSDRLSQMLSDYPASKNKPIESNKENNKSGEELFAASDFCNALEDKDSKVEEAMQICGGTTVELKQCSGPVFSNFSVKSTKQNRLVKKATRIARQ